MSLFTPIINGDLQPGKRSGHIAVYHKGFVLVYGGYGDYDDKHDEFLSEKHIWCYNVEASQWTRITTKGQHPDMTTGSCATVINSKMYLFGGFYRNKSQQNRMFMLDLNTFVWYDLTDRYRGTPPSPRDKFGFWVKNYKIVYFGGFGFPPNNIASVHGDFTFEEFGNASGLGHGWNNHLFIFDTVKLKWKQPISSGDTPSPRAAFATSQIDCKGFLFGGRFKDERRNDMYMLDLHGFRWQKIVYSNLPPIGRSWHAMAPISKNHLFIYGGFDTSGNTLADVWIYHVKEKKWEIIENSSSDLGYFSPRLWHTATNTDSVGEVVIFGGCSNSIISDERTIHTNNVAIFRYTPLKLERICLDFVVKHFGKYYQTFDELPRVLQRHIQQRKVAMGLTINGHGKLVNGCSVS